MYVCVGIIVSDFFFLPCEKVGKGEAFVRELLCFCLCRVNLDWLKEGRSYLMGALDNITDSGMCSKHKKNGTPILHLTNKQYSVNDNTINI